MLKRILKSGDDHRAANISRAKKELVRAEKRLAKLDDLFAKLYEDRAKNVVSERNYAMLSNRYQDDQIEIEAKIKVLQDRITQMAKSKENAEMWIDLISKHTEITELTAPLLNELINKIVVHEATKDENGKRHQLLEINYRFVGTID